MVLSQTDLIPDLQFPVKYNGIQLKILQTKYQIHIKWWPQNSVGLILHNYSNNIWFTVDNGKNPTYIVNQR